MSLKGERTLTTRSRSLASYSPYPAFNRSRSRLEVAIRLRSLAHTHQRACRSSQDFSRSSWIDHGRPENEVSTVGIKMLTTTPKSTSGGKLTMRVVIFRGTQRLTILGEETPKSMVRGRMTLVQLPGRNGLGQWVLRHAQFESGTGTVNGGHATGLAKITTGSDGGGRKVRGLDGGPSQGEMERWRQVRGGQLGQRETIALAGEPGNGLTMHCERMGEGVLERLGDSRERTVLRAPEQKLAEWTFRRLGHVHNGACATPVCQSSRCVARYRDSGILVMPGLVMLGSV